MSPQTEQHRDQTPLGGFEERLLGRILADYDELTTAPGRSRRGVTRRHRTPQRARIAMGACVLAAVAVVAVVVVSPFGVGRRAGTLPTLRAQSTADIVLRVRARLARLVVSGEGRVLERVSTLGAGAGDPAVRNVDWAYVDPRTKVAYQRSVDRSSGGTVLAIDRLVTTPVRGVLHTRVTFLDPSQHAYDVVADAPPTGTATAAASVTALGIRSTAAQIDDALRSGRVSQEGSATVDGQSTIRLSVPPSAAMVAAGLPARTRIILDVDPRTGEPVQEVQRSPRTHGSRGGTSISRWLPTTPRTIALAKVAIPAGYQRADGPLARFWSAAKPLFFIGD